MAKFEFLNDCIKQKSSPFVAIPRGALNGDLLTGISTDAVLGYFILLDRVCVGNYCHDDSCQDDSGHFRLIIDNSKIEELTGFSENKTIDVLKELSAFGLIRRSTYAGRRRSEIYVMDYRTAVKTEMTAKQRELIVQMSAAKLKMDPRSQHVLDLGYFFYCDFLNDCPKQTDFLAVPKAYSMPTGTDQERAAKAEALEVCTRKAVLVPIEICEAAFKGIALQEELSVKGSALALSDVGVGAVCLKAALQGGWLNIVINISGYRGSGWADEIDSRIRPMVEEGSILADRIYAQVEQKLSE